MKQQSISYATALLIKSLSRDAETIHLVDAIHSVFGRESSFLQWSIMQGLLSLSIKSGAKEVEAIMIEYLLDVYIPHIEKVLGQGHDLHEYNNFLAIKKAVISNL